MIELLKQLSQKIPLYLFSNQTELNTIYLKPLLKPYFKYMFFSNETKIHKPDRKAYDLLLKNMQSNPKESLYIDDLVEPLRVAETYGISTYHFESVDKFKKDLEKVILVWIPAFAGMT
jgi:HAD superfamily hydrolase (TIGR01549 family)